MKFSVFCSKNTTETSDEDQETDNHYEEYGDAYARSQGSKSFKIKCSQKYSPNLGSLLLTENVKEVSNYVT